MIKKILEKEEVFKIIFLGVKYLFEESPELLG